MVEELEELLLGPGGGTLDAEVIEDEEGGALHHLEELVIADIAAGLVGGAEVVEEVGNDHEKGGAARLYAAAGDGSGKMRLTAAVGSGEDEPAGGLVRKAERRRHSLGEAFLVERVGAAAARAQVFEGEAGERSEIAVALEAGDLVLLKLVLDALAGKGAAEVGMAETDWPADVAGATAERADVCFFRRVRGGRAGRAGRLRPVFRRRSVAPSSLLQNVVQTFHSPVPRSPSGGG